MDRFSIYDLLGLILPGAVFMFMLNTLKLLFCILPDYVLWNEWEIILLFSLIFGAVLYVLSFYLVNKTNWFNNFFRVYISVAVLYEESEFLHTIMNDKLNERAKEWYGKRIFFSKIDYLAFNKKDKNEIDALQDEFYARMYYELDYNEKLNVPKAFQSFYFFFRQLLIAACISLIFFTIFFICSRFSCWGSGVPSLTCSIVYFAFIVLMIFVFSWLARWYRKRMVMKMYWFYYMHINSKK